MAKWVREEGRRLSREWERVPNIVKWVKEGGRRGSGGVFWLQ